jgi:hypothetical protein
MGGAVPPIPQYALVAWCSVRRSTWTTLPYLFTFITNSVPSNITSDIKRPIYLLEVKEA